MPTTLRAILCSPAERPNVVRDAAALVESEVKGKTGLTGLAVKAAFAVVTAVKPGMIVEVVDLLLEQFIDQMEPFFAEWSAAGKGEPLEAFLVARQARVTAALLQVTDARAKVVDSATLKKAYLSLRPQGERHVALALPNLARMVGRYVSGSG